VTVTGVNDFVDDGVTYNLILAPAIGDGCDAINLTMSPPPSPTTTPPDAEAWSLPRRDG